MAVSNINSIANSHNSTNFDDYYFDDNNVSPSLRAKIEFEVDLIGKLIEAREQIGFTFTKYSGV